MQDSIEASNGWDLDSRLELAMDALRLPPPDADVTHALGRRAPPRRAVPAAAASRPTCCCSTSRRTISTPSRSPGSSASSRSIRAPSSRSPTIATSSTTSPGGFSSSIADRAFRGKGTTRPGWSRNRSASALEEKPESKRQRTLQRELDWIRHVAARAPGQGQGAAQRLRRAARRGDRAEGRAGRDLHPAGPAPRRHRRRGARPAQGLRRPAADGRRQLHAAARRHRRRDRSERRRQDDAVPDDHGTGAAGRRHAAARRDRARSATSISRATRWTPTRRVWEEITGGDDEVELGKRDGRLARLRVVVQLQGPRPAAQGRRAVGRRAQPRPPGEAAQGRRATCCCSTSRPTTSTSTRCARSKRRC